MGLSLKKQGGGKQIPVFKNVVGMTTGGFRLNKPAKSTETHVKAGTPLLFNEKTRIATIATTAEMSKAQGLAFDDVPFSDGVAFVDAVYMGEVYANRLPVSAEELVNLKTALMAQIHFSDSL